MSDFMPSMKRSNRRVIKKAISLWLISCAILLFSQYTDAHSGRTDSNGGHKDNKNKSGLGSYHYHHGYGPHLHTNGVCPYMTIKEPDEPDTIYADSVEINASDSILDIDESKTLSVTITPSNTTDKDIFWSTSNADIVSIGSSGVVTAKSAGMVTITAKTSNNKTHSISISVNVKEESISNNASFRKDKLSEHRKISSVSSGKLAINQGEERNDSAKYAIGIGIIGAVIAFVIKHKK